MWFSDTAGGFDCTHGTGIPFNQGVIDRYQITSESQVFDVHFHPKLELFSTPRLIVPSTLHLKFTRSPDSFYMMASDSTVGYKVKIMSAKFYLRVVCS